jgi:8-oxo-dGTP diphosphatase
MKPPAIRLAFDCVVLSVLERKLHVALARRNPVNEVGDADPFPNCHSLPGSYVRDDEAVADTIRRRLGPEIGLALNPVPLGVFDDPKRDPRHRVVSITFYALIPPDQASQLQWGGAYKSGAWYPADKLPEKGWAFDHRQIVRRALSELRYHALREPTGFALLSKNFMLRELHALQEQLRQEDIDLRNFRKYIVRTGLVREVGSRPGKHGYPTKLYEVQEDVLKELKEKGYAAKGQ